MGIFYEQTTVINRAPIAITIRFDGQDLTLKPGANIVPKLAVQYGKNQNPIMGSASFTDPSIHGSRYLIGEPGVDRDEDCVPLTDEEWQEHLGKPCRLNEQEIFEERYANDPKARMIVHGQKFNKQGETSPARNRSEAGLDRQGISSFEPERV